MQKTENEVTVYVQQVLGQVRRAVVGKDAVLLWVLAAILARGHILLEDIPGVGKTTMALAFSRVLDLQYSRVQFTPDVLPSDVTGYSVPDPRTGEMQYQPGAVLCNLFLADELNRATSRTQSALLEAMEEGQVTVDGVSHPIPEPFVVIATQNPVGAAGTQLLPDSQLDRFMVRLSLGYPSPKDEAAMVLNRQGGNPLHALRPLMSREELTAIQDTVEATFVSDSVVNYIVSLITATRQNENILRGASPRATLAVTAMAKSVAQLRGRDYVVPGDVREVFPQTVAHRLILSPRAETQGKCAELVLRNILDTVPVPKLRCYGGASDGVPDGTAGGSRLLYCLRGVDQLAAAALMPGASLAVAACEPGGHPPFPGGARGTGHCGNGGRNGAVAPGLLSGPHAPFPGKAQSSLVHHRGAAAVPFGKGFTHGSLRRRDGYGGKGTGLRLLRIVFLPGQECIPQDHDHPAQAPGARGHPVNPGYKTQKLDPQARRGLRGKPRAAAVPARGQPEPDPLEAHRQDRKVDPPGAHGACPGTDAPDHDPPGNPGGVGPEVRAAFMAGRVSAGPGSGL